MASLAIDRVTVGLLWRSFNNDAACEIFRRELCGAFVGFIRREAIPLPQRTTDCRPRSSRFEKNFSNLAWNRAIIRFYFAEDARSELLLFKYCGQV